MDRCPTCDRVIATTDNADDGMCEVELSFNSRRTSDWNRRARRDCAAHAVDWRARALAAEAALVELTERAASSGAPVSDNVDEAIANSVWSARWKAEAAIRAASTATRAERAGAILDRAIADLAAIGVECQASAHRETAVAAAMVGAPVLSLCLSATVHDADEVIP